MTMSTKEISEILNKALEIELEGRKFYLECMAKTKHSGGQEMFRYLAEEEWIHYETVEKVYRREFEKEYLQFKKTQTAKEPASGIFPKMVPGGNIDKKSDALDALNIAIKAEDNSVLLYQRLAGGSKNEKLKKVFTQLAAEEKKHFYILENEVESVTKTGAYSDFKIVTT
jgi:rubrerythrin